MPPSLLLLRRDFNASARLRPCSSQEHTWRPGVNVPLIPFIRFTLGCTPHTIPHHPVKIHSVRTCSVGLDSNGMGEGYKYDHILGWTATLTPVRA